MTIRPPRIDWFRVIVDLERARWSLERIAVTVERSKGWVSNLKNIPGTEPRFHDGLMLLGLWSQVTGHEQQRVELLSVDVDRKRPRGPITYGGSWPGRVPKGQERAQKRADTAPDSKELENHGETTHRADPGRAAARSERAVACSG